jgi:hypothetical protein
MQRMPPSLSAADSARHRLIVGRIDAYIEGLGPQLRGTVRPFYAGLAEGDFARVVVLLPYWLGDVLPVSGQQLDDLATAHLTRRSAPRARARPPSCHEST